MKRQPAARCCGQSAFFAAAAVRANESSSCRGTDVVESRLARSKLDSASKKNSSKCLATSLRIELRKLAYVRSVQRMCVRYEVPLLGVTRARVHVRVNRVDNAQECLLRDPVRRRVGHELARKEWPVRVHSIGLLLKDNLCPHAASHVCSKCDRDERARSKDMG